MSYGPEAQNQLLKLAGVKTPNWIKTVVIMAATVFILFMLIAAIYLHTRQKPDPVAHLYHQFCRKLRRIGIERGATEGPFDFAERLISARPDLRQAVGRITDTYIKLRYGHFSKRGLALLRRQVADFKISPQTGGGLLSNARWLS